MQFNLNSNSLANAATIAALSVVGITFAALPNQQASAQTFTGGAINSTSLSGYDSQVFNSKQLTHVDNNGNIYELYITKGGSWKFANLS
ncbi:hypothetical protein, partial [Nostoc sp. CALU 1950]|uniref:hypothetical protein n=1 Tax=Nostoc sp. CALU 1950 TaxID=3104321 RepID=UPI003EBB8E0F